MFSESLPWIGAFVGSSRQIGFALTIVCALVVWSGQAIAQDTDGDGLADAVEAGLGTDPLRADTDDDGAMDLYEIQLQTNPLDAASQPRAVIGVFSSMTSAPSPASEGSGVETTSSGGPSSPAGASSAGGFVNLVGFQMQTLLARDLDADGLIGFAEAAAGTSFAWPDTDGDGFVDGFGGVRPRGSLIYGFDLDGDGFVDGEADFGTDPTDGSSRIGRTGDVAPLGLPDGVVDVADTLVEWRIVRDPSILTQLSADGQQLTREASDLNGDGEANAADVLLQVNQVRGGP